MNTPLYAIRRALSLSQTELGSLIGHPASTISAWERKGEHAPISAATLQALRVELFSQFGLRLTFDELLVPLMFDPQSVKEAHLAKVYAFKARRQLAEA